MKLNLDFMEAFRLASVLDEVIESEVFHATSDEFQTCIVNVYNRVIDLIKSIDDDVEVSKE